MSETCKFAGVDLHPVKMQKIQNLRVSFTGVVKKYRLAQAAFRKGVVRSTVASKQAAAHDIFTLRFFFEYQKIVVSVSCLCLCCPSVSWLCLLSLSLLFVFRLLSLPAVSVFVFCLLSLSALSVSCLCLLSLSPVSLSGLCLLSLSPVVLLLYLLKCNFD